MRKKNVGQSLRGSASHFTVKDVIALKPNHHHVLHLGEQGLTTAEFGSRIWRSSYLLIDYLSNLHFTNDQHIVELGCGWGLPSAYIQKTFGAKVTATDSDPQVRHYQQLISTVNQTDVTFSQQSFAGLAKQNLADIHVLMGADICYSPANAAGLLTLLQTFRQCGDGEIIIADTGRPPFFQLANALENKYSVSLTAVTLNLPTRVTGQVLHIKRGSC